jgi:hemerythrin superfamily protein
LNSERSAKEEINAHAHGKPPIQPVDFQSLKLEQRTELERQSQCILLGRRRRSDHRRSARRSGDQTQTFKRKMLFMKLCHALDKHAHAEEMIVYPALREDDDFANADHLESEHGYIKTFIYELNEMGPDSPNWLEKVREFRQLLSEHAHMEEEQVFPKFKKDMSEEQNAHITSLVNRDGFWMS